MKRQILLLFLCIPLLCGAKKLRPLVWVLDAGHGGRDVGCESKKSQEKDITLEVTKEVAALIRKHKPGIKLILTRETDEYLSLDERCQKANKANADLFLSIHVNTVEWKPLLSGTETFFASTKGLSDAVLQSAQSRNLPKSEMLAWLLQKNYYEAGRPTERGAKPEVLYVLRHTMMPAVLTEIGFLSNRKDEAYMTSKKGQKEIALCIYNALAEYYQTTQAKTERKTLATLRSSGGRKSGLKIEKVKANANVNANPNENANANPNENANPNPNENANPNPNANVGGQVAAQPVTDSDNPPLEQQWAESALAQGKKVNANPNANANPNPNLNVNENENQNEGENKNADANENENQNEGEGKNAEGTAETEQPVQTEATEDAAAREEPQEAVPVEKPQEAAPEEKTEPASGFINSPAIPVFSIQIVAVSSELKSDDERLKGLYPVTFVKSGNMFKGLYGGTTDYKQAKATLASIREKFPDAFIVAYLGEEPIPTSRALEMTSKK
ncbi:MAG: N-acetylmuramoyl-L-alanine amidase [Bacteroidaceae bacterium]|nr:N-acetylmuramoyl-L-alanine amidase [Bacteroidaceae bacterium]